MPDFGFADYVSDVPNVFGQMRYLQAVSNVVPEAIEELKALPLDDYDKWFAWADRRGFLDQWAFNAAAEHRARWQQYAELNGKWLMLAESHWEPVMPMLAPWNPFVESEAAFRETIRALHRAMQGRSCDEGDA